MQRSAWQACWAVKEARLTQGNLDGGEQQARGSRSITLCTVRPRFFQKSINLSTFNRDSRGAGVHLTSLCSLNTLQW